MASTIQIKRGTGSAVPSGLADGELAINLDDGKFYFGSASVSVSDFKFNTLTVNELTSSIITSSIIETSGSNIFGDDSSDTHLFRGNITASNNISASGDLILGGGISFDGDETIATIGSGDDLTINPQRELLLGTAATDAIKIGRQSGTGGAGRTEIYANTSTIAAKFQDSSITFNHAITASGTISSSGYVTANHITSSGNLKVGASTTTPILLEPRLINFNPEVNGNGVNFKVDDVNMKTTISGLVEFELNANKIELGQSATQHVTASGNISASGDITAGDITASGAFFTGNVTMGKLTATAGGSSLAGIVSVGTQDGDDRLHIARYRNTSTIYPFAHIYAGLSGLGEKCGFKIVVKNNSGNDGDGLKIDGNTKEATFYNVVNCTKLNTGQGDHELYDMNQDVKTSDDVVFDSITATGQGNISGDLYANQYIRMTSSNAGIFFTDPGNEYTFGVGQGGLIINAGITNPASVNHFMVSSSGGTGATSNGRIGMAATPHPTSILNVGGDITYGSPVVTQGTAKIVISQAQANALHTTPIELVPAQGANTVIVPVNGMVRVDRAATQTNSAANMDFHYNGVSPSYSTTSLIHLRRFMYNDTGDRVFAITTPGVEIGQNLTDDVNAALEVSISSALTTNCVTSITIFLTYNVFDIS